ncbi:MAG: sulfite exporter TauE/SafE family protein [Burkholderiaceae bacterium]
MQPDSLWQAFTAFSLTISIIGLFAGGLCKGAVGIGLPFISVPVLAFFVSVPKALAILAIPIFLTNALQFFQGGLVRPVLKRYGLTTVMLVIGIGLGTQLLIAMPVRLSYLLMGLVILTYPALRLTGRSQPFSLPREKWLAPSAGLLSGLLGGVTGFFAPVIVAFLAIQRLDKNLFSASVGLILFSGTIALSSFLASFGVLGREELIASALALIPIFIGLRAGQAIRQYISQKSFERILTVVMTLIGITMILRAL